MTDQGGQIDTVMQEERLFPPSAEFSSQSRIKSMEEYQALWEKAQANPQEFWAELAREELHWFEPFSETLRWNEPFAEWFVGGKTNVSYNCLDRNIEARLGRSNCHSLGRRARRQPHIDVHASCIARSASLPTV